MSNETTILRFDFGDRPSEVRADIVAEMVATIASLFGDVVGPFAHSNVQMFHALAPRRGSIEFHFRPEININIRTEALADGGKKQWIDRAMLGVGVATLLWTAVFGQDGVLHGALSPDKPMPSKNEAAEIVPQLNHDPMGIEQLTNAAFRSGADRVEIQVPDNAPVVIYGIASRKEGRLIGRVGRAHGALIHNTSTQSVRVSAERPIRVDFHGKTFNAYIGEVVGPTGEPVRSAIIWGSNVPVGNSDVLAQLQPISVDEIKAVDAVPIAYERVDAIYFVNAVAQFQ